MSTFTRDESAAPRALGCRARRPGKDVSPLLAAGFLTVILLCGCSKPKPAASAPPPPQVGVVTLTAQATPLRTELPGWTVGSETSEVRPQVTGLVRSVPFNGGALVRAGDLLYQLDDAPFRAAVDQAAAVLANGEATLIAARAMYERYAALLTIGGVALQDEQTALAAYREALANVAQYKALLQAARINLGYTRITAPITGRISRSLVSEGALVLTGQTTALATIQQYDPILVDVTQSAAEILRLRRALSSGGVVPASAPVTLSLPDGSEYGTSGTLEFTEQMVDPTTGSVTIRASFANPTGLVLTGMYVRALITQASNPDAILAPQQGIGRNTRGQPTALVVGAGNRVEQRIIETGETMGAQWVVTSGLKPGDRLIVEGLQRAQPGTVVNPVPATLPTQPAAAGPPVPPTRGG